MYVTIDLFGYSCRIDYPKKTVFYLVEEKDGMFFLYKRFNSLKNKKKFLVESRKNPFVIEYDAKKSLKIKLKDKIFSPLEKIPSHWKNLENAMGDVKKKKDKKERKCLKCDNFFLSSWNGERFCDKHKPIVPSFEHAFLGEDSIYV